MSNNINIIELLINNNANVNAINNGGNTALHVASLNGKIDAIEILINKNADINFKND